MRRSVKSAFFSSLAALVVSLGVALAPAPARADYLGFADVSPSDWAAKQGYIDYVASEGLMSGLSETSFGPAEPLSRAQVATVLWRVAGEPEPDAGVGRFPDCDYSEGSFYGEAVSWARETGVVTGYEDGRFGPADPVTREQLATMLARYAGGVAGLDASSDGSVLSAMADASSVTLWDGMAWAVDAGVLTGDLSTGEPLALPQRPAQRDQAAKMFAVFHRDVLGEGGAPGEPDPSQPTTVDYADDVVLLDTSVSGAAASGEDVTVTLGAGAGEVSEGDVVVFGPTEGMPFGGAVKVESVEAGGRVTGARPELSEVYDELVINETLGLEDLDLSSVRLMSGYADKLEIEVSQDIGEYGTAKGTITINDITIKPFLVLLGPFSYMDMSFECDMDAELALELSMIPSDLRSIKLLSVPVPLLSVPGTGVHLNVYLEIDAAASVSLSSSIEVSASAKKDVFGAPEFEGDCDIDLADDVSISAKGKVGLSPAAALEILGWSASRIGVEAGVGAEVETSYHPGLTCTDAAMWVYSDAYAEFLGGTDLDLEASIQIFDKDDSPLKRDVHLEDGLLVDECTWKLVCGKYGAFYDKLQELEESYGEGRLVSGGFGSIAAKWLTGLCFAGVHDFGDGVERLVTACGTGTTANSYPNYLDAYEVTVWEYDEKNGELEAVWRGEHSHSNGGYAYLIFSVAPGGGRSYLMRNIPDAEYTFVGVRDDGSFGVVSTASAVVVPNSPEGFVCTVDGVRVTMQQYWDVLASMGANSAHGPGNETSWSLAAYGQEIDDPAKTLQLTRETSAWIEERVLSRA